MSNFIKFKRAIQTKFAKMQSFDLFQTNIDKDTIWQTYLDSFPHNSNPIFRKRSQHDCSACRRFIKIIGNIVNINEDGTLDTIWDLNVDDNNYQIVANSMAAFVKQHTINGQFYHYQKIVGVEKSFEDIITDNGKELFTWEHFCVTLPSKYIHTNMDINKIHSEEISTFNVVKRSCEELTISALETVIELINQGSLYRGNEHLHIVNKFKQFKVGYDLAINKDHFIWNNINDKSLRIRNTAIGTLLIDLSEDLDLDIAVRKFETVVAPANYKRPKPIVTKKQIEEAKKILEDAGLISSLERKIASINDIPVEHIIFLNSDIKPMAIKDVFDDMSDSVTVDPKKMSKVEKINIKDFIMNVVPKAKSIEILVESRHKTNTFIMTSPQDFSAPMLFKWNNPFAWGYIGNVTDSIKEKVKSAGGKIDADICCRLGWKNSDDLDLHMIEPNGYHINFSNKRSYTTGGELDVDMNAGGIQNSVDPVENIFYPDIKKMKPGIYKLYVNQYSNRNSETLNNYGFTIEVEILNDIHTFNYSQYMPTNKNVDICNIIIKPNLLIELQSLIPSELSSVTVNGVKTQTFAKVKAIMLSPNYWETKIGNLHYFFVIDGCVPEENPRGIYNEFIREDIGVNKRVFELLGSKLKTEMSPNPVTGLGFSETQRNTIFVKVSGTFTRILEVTF